MLSRHSMELRLPLFGVIRLSSLALVATLLIALAGLFAVDRALSEHERVEAELQAVETAAAIEGFLAVHAEALQSVRLLFIAGRGEVPPEDFRSLMGPMLEYAAGFQRVWVTDSNGRVRHEYLLGVDGAALPPDVLLDTLRVYDIAVLTRDARTTRRTQVSTRGDLLPGEHGFLLLEPLFLDDRFLGYAGGSIAAGSLLGTVLRRHDARLHDFMVVAGEDTIAIQRWEGVRAFARSASATVTVPGSQQWTVLVTRTVAGPWLRLTVWAVGTLTLGALFVSLLHERRQGRRVEERTAELERLSSELLRANRAKSEFLASVSHELRTPLNAIVGFVELLRDGVYGDLSERQTAPVERIASSAAHLRALVDQVLDIAKMAAGRLEVEREAVELRPFVHDVATEVESLVTERGLTLSVTVGGELPRVYTDRTHLRQILINLLGNAAKFTERGGIFIRAHLVTRAEELPQLIAAPTPPPSVEHPWFAIQVVDSGVGIAPADQERIFGEFEQVNAGPRTDSMQRGTGLGLPISRRLARLLGGAVTVTSVLGRGSTFTVWLPMGDPGLEAGVKAPGLESRGTGVGAV